VSNNINQTAAGLFVVVVGHDTQIQPFTVGPKTWTETKSSLVPLWENQ